MKKLIREFFFLRKGERRALVVMVGFLFISILFRIGVVYFPLPEEELNPEYLMQMKRIQAEILLQSAENAEPVVASKRQKITTIELQPFTFDPNTVSEDSLLKMNISEYVSHNIVRYREAGGSFRKKDELMKIYGMTPQIFEQLSPYIAITLPEPKLNEPISNKPKIVYMDSLPFIELNGADTLQLMSIPGIGISYSRRILKYRSILGGYFNKNQLWEVYGMDSIRFIALEQYTWIDTLKIQRLPLNTATFRELIAHPFISKIDTYSILQYRDYVDSIRSVWELEINQIIDHDSFIRMLPYLTLNESK